MSQIHSRVRRQKAGSEGGPETGVGLSALSAYEQGRPLSRLTQPGWLRGAPGQLQGSLLREPWDAHLTWRFAGVL